MERYKFFVGGESKEFTDRYTSSIEFDRIIVRYVAMVMLAHVKELARNKLIDVESAKKIVNELTDIIESSGEKLYKWIKSKNRLYEDVFEALEVYLYEVVGSEAGRIAIGRSRNDHISATLRLVLRDKVIEVLERLLELRRTLVAKALEYGNTLFPFFTHEQIAQCGSAAIYFLSYEKTFADLWLLLSYSMDLLSQNPLGSGAAAGTFVRLDIDRLSEELCFSKEFIPPYYATGSRLFLLYVVSVLSLIMVEVSRFVKDMMLLANVIRQGIEIPKHHVSTSSIMPHKRNLVTLEIARAKSSKTIGILTSLLSAYKSIPYGYNLDFQEMNVQLFDILKDVVDTLEVIKDFISGLELKEDTMRVLLSDRPCWSSDLVEYLAISTGRPVRELYAELAKVFQITVAEHDIQLENLLARYGIDKASVWTLHKLKPIEKSLDNMLSYVKERIQKDFERVKHLNSSLSRCSEMLIRRMPEA